MPAVNFPIRRSRARTVTAVAALIAYLVGTIGYPLPAISGAIARHDGSDHACRCTPALRNSGQCCCRKPNANVGKSTDAPKKGSSCCSKKSKNSPQTQVATTSKSNSRTTSTSISENTCPGITMLWVSLGAVSSPPAIIDLSIETLSIDTIRLDDQILKSRSICPASPPPKAVA